MEDEEASEQFDVDNTLDEEIIPKKFDEPVEMLGNVDKMQAKISAILLEMYDAVAKGDFKVEAHYKSNDVSSVHPKQVTQDWEVDEN